MIAAVCGAAALLGFGIVGHTTTPSPELPRTPAPAVSTAIDTRIAIAGDTGPGRAAPSRQTVQTMVDQSRQRNYDGLVLLGGLIYPEGDADQARSRITDVFAPVTSRGARLVPVLGNHDYMSDELAAILTEVGRERTWYVDQVGIVRILVLDTEQVDIPAQTAWLQETLASPDGAAWTIVAMHKPSYSAGFHGSDDEIQQQMVAALRTVRRPAVARRP